LGWFLLLQVPTSVELYVVVDFYLNIPVGYYYTTLFGSTFRPFIRGQGTNYFRTRDHQITISVADIVFNPETNQLSANNITAFSDYNNTELDYYEIKEKPVYGEDIREARWKIFMKGDFSSSHTGDLLWDSINEWWYMDDYNVGGIYGLIDGEYYLSAMITTMNVNFSTSLWSLPSEYFIIDSGESSPLVYMLPVIFLVGLVVIPGIIIVILINIRRVKNRKM